VGKKSARALEIKPNNQINISSKISVRGVLDMAK